MNEISFETDDTFWLVEHRERLKEIWLRWAAEEAVRNACETKRRYWGDAVPWTTHTSCARMG